MLGLFSRKNEKKEKEMNKIKEEVTGSVTGNHITANSMSQEENFSPVSNNNLPDPIHQQSLSSSNGASFSNESKIDPSQQDSSKDNIDDLFSPGSQSSFSSFSSNMGSSNTPNPDESNYVKEDSSNISNAFSSSKDSKKEEVINGDEAYVNTLIKRRTVSPPLFISVTKYKEIVNELVSLKVSIASLESVLNISKKASSSEKQYIKEFVDGIDKVNAKMKYFTEVFKIK